MEGKDLNKKRKERIVEATLLSQNPLNKFFTNCRLHLGMFLYAVTHPFHIPHMLSRKKQVGLLTGSIFCDPLYNPGKESSLHIDTPSAGNYEGYDFHRKMLFPKSNQRKEGLLLRFLLLR